MINHEVWCHWTATSFHRRDNAVVSMHHEGFDVIAAHWLAWPPWIPEKKELQGIMKRRFKTPEAAMKFADGVWFSQ